MNTPNGEATNQLTSSTSPPSDHSLPMIPRELTIKPPKGVVHNSSFNPRARVAKNYNIVEYLAQSPSTMSTLKVLQKFPNQKNALLLAIECVNPSNCNQVVFSHEKYTPHLLAQLDEGALTYIMSIRVN